MIRRAASGFSRRSRERKLRLFLELLAPGPGTSVVDVGVTDSGVAGAYGTDNFLEASYPWPERVTAVGVTGLANFAAAFPRVRTVVADGRALPFGDGEFDAVTISFGLRNIKETRAALAEMFRVLKPGGRVVICEFSKPNRAIFRAGYGAYLRFVMPAVVEASSSNPQAYRYLAESIADWPDQQTLSGLIRGVGFTRVAHRNLTAGVVALHRGRKPIASAVAPQRERPAPPTT